MTRLALKVCGMRDPDNILEVGMLRPAYMGFIFYRHSKRAVGSNFEIPADLSRSIKRVGVFVNEHADEVIYQARIHNLDYVQLHGDETPATCEAVRKSGIGVIKVLSIGEQADFNSLKAYKPLVNFFLFDTKSADYGGTGRLFDWNRLTDYDQEIPFFLSGGLAPDNLDGLNTLKGMNIHALDINSGVEISPGVKNVAAIERLQRIQSKFDPCIN